jgi:hypothetical protein
MGKLDILLEEIRKAEALLRSAIEEGHPTDAYIELANLENKVRELRNAMSRWHNA